MVKVCKTDLNINSVDKTLQKQRILEKSFAKLNAELFKKEANNKNNERKPKNIFMDILKIPPVIDLANMDETGNPGTSVKQSQSQIQQIEHHDDLILLSTTTGEQSKKAVNSPRKRSNLRLIGKKRRQLRSLKRKLDKMTEEAGFVVQSSPPLPVVNSISAPNLSITQGGVASSSTISDVDLREETGLNKTVRQSKQIAVQKLKEHFSIVEDINDEISIIKCSSDLDLRKESQQESKPSTSTNADISIIYTNDQLLTIRSQQQSRKKSFEKELINYNTFSNRIRFKHRSIQIDLSKNYKLVGLRYFQEILGKEVSVSDKFIQVPLTVVSFNVLCQHYVGAMPHLYKHLDAKGVIYASWSYRAKKLKEEFDRVDADVFCLQEVQDDHFVEFYRPYFKKRNFCGVFTRKTGGLSTPDGCAIFWRQSKLTLLHLTSVTNNLKSFNNPSIGQVALFGLNESINSNSAICISNTHIYYNMKKGIVKLAQIAYLLGHMKKVENEFLASMKSEQELNKKTNFAGHILCGDFNIEPFSPLHDFLLEQKINLRLNPSKLAFKNTSFDSVDICSIFGTPPPLLSLPLVEMYLSTNSEIVDPNDSSFGKHLFKPNGERLTHDFSFASVYEYLNVNNEPEISSYHCDVSSPDFIFYTVPKCNNVQTFKEDPNVEITEQQLAVEGLIQLRKRLSLPTKAELNKACGKLPNEHYGSDHLLLYAHFDIFCPLADFSFT